MMGGKCVEGKVDLLLVCIGERKSLAGREGLNERREACDLRRESGQKARASAANTHHVRVLLNLPAWSWFVGLERILQVFAQCVRRGARDEGIDELVDVFAVEVDASAELASPGIPVLNVRLLPVCPGNDHLRAFLWNGEWLR